MTRPDPRIEDTPESMRLAWEQVDEELERQHLEWPDKWEQAAEGRQRSGRWEA